MAQDLATSAPQPRVAVESMVYQAQTLLDRLEAFQRGDFPPEALEIAFLLASFAEYLRDTLSDLAKLDEPTPTETGRARSLLLTAQELYALLRYVQASDSKYTPPSTQVALTGIAKRVFPESPEDIVALVRPQWAYNLKYVPLTWVLRSMVQFETLDPDNVLLLIDPQVVPTPQYEVEIADKFLQEIWRRRWKRLEALGLRPEVRTEAPRQLAVLSFAGLDKDVTYQFPILAHELGHFIDFSHYPAHHADPRIVQASWVDRSDVEKAIGAGQSPTSGQVDRYWQELTDRVSVCIREILADLLGVRIMGLGFFLAQSEFLTRVFGWNQPRVTRTGYPGLAYRLGIIVEEVQSIGGSGNLRAFFDKHREGEKRIRDIAKWSADNLINWESRIAQELQLDRQSAGDSPALQALDDLAAQAVEKALPVIRTVAAELLPSDKAAVLSPLFFDRVFSLGENLPPAESGDTPAQVPEIMSASWTYQLMFGQRAERQQQKAEDALNEFRKSCRLVLKALELAAASNELKVDETPPSRPYSLAETGAHGVLDEGELRRRLALQMGESGRIALIPRSVSMIQSASIDVRLGHWFKVARRPRLPAIDLTTEGAQKIATEVAHEEIFVPFGERLTIHPGDFVLGATLEFIALPDDLMAFVEGRSRLGRTGLIVATATSVAPGFHGCVVLELANTGAIPIQVKPAMGVAQIVFMTLTNRTRAYSGSSQCQIKP